MKAIRTIAAAALLALALAGCGAGDRTAAFQHISVLNGSSIAVHARRGPNAVISADGTLRIGDRDVALTPAQQALFKQYFDHALALRSDAIATGVAGAATAGSALRSVVSGLANGTPDKIGPAVEARAATVQARAAQVCDDLSALHSTQQAIAEQVVEFRPYAVIEAQPAGACNRG